MSVVFILLKSAVKVKHFVLKEINNGNIKVKNIWLIKVFIILWRIYYRKNEYLKG
jgi:hypothetical protein